MNALISIVIPTYNRAEDLKRALKSVMEQTYTNWEVVIVDNHSTDNTDDIIKDFGDSRIKLFKIHNHGIIASSRNLGILKAEGEYVAFLDSDDWWMPNKLLESIKFLNQGMDVVYHELLIVKKKGQKFLWKKTPTRKLSNPVFNDLMINGNGLSNSSVVVRKSYLDAIGGLSEDPDLVAMEDYDAWLRVAKLTQKYYKIPKVLGYYWAGGGNVTNPVRLFRYIDAFKLRYKDDIKNLELQDKMYWPIYAGGRAHYLLRSYEDSKKNLDLIRWKQVPFFIYLKSCWMLSLIYFRLHLKSH